MNNKLRIAGLAALALLAAWLVVRGCTPEPKPALPPTASTRAAFHASKPLRLELLATPDADGGRSEIAWLDLELRHLLMRGKMHVAPIGLRAARPASRDSRRSEEDAPAGETFTLRVALSADGRQALVALIAPDHVLERERTLEIPEATRLAAAQVLAKGLPRFLGAADAASDWSELLGTADARGYDAFTRASTTILGPGGRGFTRPSAGPERARAIERLERVVRSQPRFVRARALLATGYLSLGGEDEASLTHLAESNAERAVALDAAVAEAHAALGLVALRRNEWVAARDQFDAALTLDPNSAPALEGMACLLADAGRYTAAQPLAMRAVALQPRNIGANECLTYTSDREQTMSGDSDSANDGPADEHVLALKAMLAAEVPAADRLLRAALRPQQFELWAQPVLRAADNRRHVPDALRAVTRAANDERISASTEILCGAALRQSEFVFNRMTRLQRQRAHAPLRILWLPQTAFLRQHTRFEDVISAAGLPAFWEEHGAPDVCASEPKTYGCKPQKPVAAGGRGLAAGGANR